MFRRKEKGSHEALVRNRMVRRVIRGIWDALLMVSIITLVCFPALQHFMERNDEGDLVDQKKVLADLVLIPWGSPTVSFDDKFERLFNNVKKIMQLEQNWTWIQNFAYVVSLLMVLKMMAFLKAHPRVGLLVEALHNGFDDLWHFMIMYMTLFVALGQIATWQFGKDDQAFETLAMSMNTMFQMGIGEYPWNEEGEEVLRLLFLLFFSLVFFFLLTNMFLAIILDAFEKAKTAWQIADEEQGLFADAFHVIMFRLLQHWYQWPTHRELMLSLDGHFAATNTNGGGDPQKQDGRNLHGDKKDNGDDLDPSGLSPSVSCEEMLKETAHLGRHPYCMEQMFMFYWRSLPVLREDYEDKLATKEMWHVSTEDYLRQEAEKAEEREKKKSEANAPTASARATADSVKLDKEAHQCLRNLENKMHELHLKHDEIARLLQQPAPPDQAQAADHPTDHSWWFQKPFFGAGCRKEGVVLPEDALAVGGKQEASSTHPHR